MHTSKLAYIHNVHLLIHVHIHVQCTCMCTNLRFSRASQPGSDLSAKGRGEGLE